MAFSGGVFSLVAGNPVVTGTTISSTTMNNTLSDIATGLSTCVLKDGSQTITANIPMSSFKFTGLAAGSASGDSLRYQQLIGVYPVMTLGTSQASTSGTAIDFTSIPANTQRVTINFVGVSTNGTNSWLIQIGDSGGIQTSGYLGSGQTVGGGAANFTAGFGFTFSSAASVAHGSLVLSLEKASAFTWTAYGMLGTSNAAAVLITAGSKSVSAALDRVRITTTGGVDTFDAGEINIIYEYIA